MHYYDNYSRHAWCITTYVGRSKGYLRNTKTIIVRVNNSFFFKEMRVIGQLEEKPG